MIETAENRLKRLRMRSWRRGTKEMDLILGPFADARIAAIDPGRLDAYEDFLSENDHDLYLWISGVQEFPAQHTEIITLIREYHRIL